jgi:hypothetical protein
MQVEKQLIEKFQVEELETRLEFWWWFKISRGGTTIFAI